MNSPKKTVLLVDDNPDIQTVIKMSLEHIGYQVTCASDGTEAMECLSDVRPDIAIIDFGLPGADGISVGQQIRQSEVGEQTKLVLFTGTYDAELKEQAQAVGFVDYLVKPLRINELKKRLEQLESNNTNETAT